MRFQGEVGLQNTEPKKRNCAEKSIKEMRSSRTSPESILASDFWSVSYDYLLRLEIPHGSYLVGNAKNAAILIMSHLIGQTQRTLAMIHPTSKESRSGRFNPRKDWVKTKT